MWVVREITLTVCIPLTLFGSCYFSEGGSVEIELMKKKALRKHSLRRNIAASVLLKLFISANERCHTNDAPNAWAELYFQM